MEGGFLSAPGYKQVSKGWFTICRDILSHHVLTLEHYNLFGISCVSFHSYAVTQSLQLLDRPDSLHQRQDEDLPKDKQSTL